ncbi:MAG: hypothetical protein KC503_12390 [Myxococcales bacterium]|nr:hypothetical protein [Myxococcales bacterium]
MSEAAAPTRQQQRRVLVQLGASGVVATICYAVITRATSLSQLRPLAATLIATLPFIVAARVALSREAAALSRRALLAVVVLGVVAMRLAVPLGKPTASDDAYRYLWDGRVQAAGHNPYAYPPQHPRLVELRDARFYPNVFRPDLRTVYPGLAEMWFVVAYAISPSGFIGLKLVLLLHDLAALLLLWRLLSQRGLAPARVVLYVWSPLVVVQLYAGCHLDGLIVPWLLACVMWAESRPLLAGAALGASAMVRPITALCGPALALRRPIKEGALAALGFVVAAALCVLPYARAGAKMVESLLVYSKHWQFNGSLFRLLDALLNQKRWFRNALYAGIAAGSLGIGALRRPPRSARMALALALYFAFAPTVYPWYLIAPLALAVLHGSGLLVVALPALASLADLVWLDGVVGGQWSVPTWALLLEYGGLYGLLGYELWRGRRPAAPQRE